ncbi:MAG: hypothetical protein Q7T55_23675, partial [Solirubrobacteraceae bacterium]|nr:hypothetical protein [Solirubrobacteraceae bacterium]
AGGPDATPAPLPAGPTPAPGDATPTSAPTPIAQTPTPGGATPPGSLGTPGDTSPTGGTPAVSAVGVSQSTFAAGTSVSFTLTSSHAGTARVVISKATPGRRAAGTCKAQTKANKKAKKCTFDKVVTTLSASAASGKVSIPFNGKIGKKTLAPGTYRATITVTSSTGEVSNPTVLTFKVKAAKKKAAKKK